ncbi:MAG TPA: hypothetical protein VKV22_02635 [Rhodanobacteraceae bacterium]|nr:hypothetical protein [Rhodanobacteraceae bacterium]
MHAVLCRRAVSLRTLYVDPRYDSNPRDCRVLEVSDFLKALILEVVKFSDEYDLEGRERRIVWLLLDLAHADGDVPPGMANRQAFTFPVRQRTSFPHRPCLSFVRGRLIDGRAFAVADSPR